MDEFKPGQVISPQSVPSEPPTEPVTPVNGAPEPDRPMEQPGPEPVPIPAPEPPADPIETTEPMDSAAQANVEPAPWQYTQDVDPAAASEIPLPENLDWTASEFMIHEKGFGWYGMLAVAGVIGAALAYLLTKDVFSTGVIIFAAVAFGAYAGHKPSTQQYSLTRQGLQIGEKFYGFQDFKTFSVAEEGAITSIILMPLKRFMPPRTLYVSPEMEDQVVDFLSAVLPFEQHRADAIDSLLRRIRF